MFCVCVQYMPLISAQLFYDLVLEFYLVIFFDHVIILLLTFIRENHFSK
jgi:hypothetical protein